MEMSSIPRFEEALEELRSKPPIVLEGERRHGFEGHVGKIPVTAQHSWFYSSARSKRSSKVVYARPDCSLPSMLSVTTKASTAAPVSFRLTEGSSYWVHGAYREELELFFDDPAFRKELEESLAAADATIERGRVHARPPKDFRDWDEVSAKLAAVGCIAELVDRRGGDLSRLPMRRFRTAEGNASVMLFLMTISVIGLGSFAAGLIIPFALGAPQLALLGIFVSFALTGLAYRASFRLRDRKRRKLPAGLEIGGGRLLARIDGKQVADVDLSEATLRWGSTPMGDVLHIAANGQELRLLGHEPHAISDPELTSDENRGVGEVNVLPGELRDVVRAIRQSRPDLRTE